MKVTGVSIVRNEADLLPATLRYHLGLGLDEVLLVDNASTDDTPKLLRRFRRDPRLRWTRNEGTFQQVSLTNELVHEARRRGADWVLVFDADEFWHAPGGDLRGVLAASQAGALLVQFANFVQRRSQLRNRPNAILHMVYRAPVQEAPDAAQAVAAQAISFVEAPFPPKWIVRPTESYCGAKGTHRVEGVSGQLEATDRIVCLHAPLRSREQLTRKAANAERHVAAGVRPGESWQTIRWGSLAAADALEAEWKANSYDTGGDLDVYGQRHPLVRDTRLRDLVRPHVPMPWALAAGLIFPTPPGRSADAGFTALFIERKGR